MSDIKLNSNHDLSLSDNSLSLTSEGDESIAQRLKIRLWAFKGEWFWNTNFGVPYFQEVFVKGATVDDLEDIFKKQILQCPGIINLNSFEMNVDTSSRKITIGFTAQIGRAHV